MSSSPSDSRSAAHVHSQAGLVPALLELPADLHARIRRVARIAGYTPEQAMSLILNANIRQFENAWKAGR